MTSQSRSISFQISLFTLKPNHQYRKQAVIIRKTDENLALNISETDSERVLDLSEQAKTAPYIGDEKGSRDMKEPIRN